MRSRNEYDHRDYSFNVQVIGSSGSGKGSLILRYADNIFTGLPTETLRSVSKTKCLSTDGSEVQLNISDYKRKFKRINYENNQAILIAIDVTSKASFKELLYYIEEVKRFNDTRGENILIIVVATKYGDENTVVNYQNLIAVCESYHVDLTCVNAKTGFNVNSLFTNCAALLVANQYNSNDITNQVKETISKNLVDAYTLENKFIEANIKQYRYRCLAVIQGKNQTSSPIHYLPNEILNVIFSMLPHWGNNESFAAVIFSGMLQQIHTMRFINSYKESFGYKGSDSKSFVKNLHGLCDKEPNATTKAQIEESIVTFAEKKIKDKQGHCRAVNLLITHGLYTPSNTDTNDTKPTRENCIIC